MGDVRPGSDMSDPRGQGVDIALGAVQALDLVGHPILWQASAIPFYKVLEDLSDQSGVVVRHDFAEVWDLTDIPQEPHSVLTAAAGHDLWVPH